MAFYPRSYFAITIFVYCIGHICYDSGSDAAILLKVQLPSNPMVMGLNLHWWNTWTKAVYTGGGQVYKCTGDHALGLLLF